MAARNERAVVIRHIVVIGVLVAAMISLSAVAVPAESYSAPHRAKQHDKHAKCSASSKKHSHKDKRASRSAAKCRDTGHTQSHKSNRTPSKSPPSTSPPSATTTPSTPSPAPTTPPSTLTPPSCPPLKKPVATAGTGVYGDILVEGGPVFWTCAEQPGGEVQVLNSSGTVVASTTIAEGETFNLTVEPGTYSVVRGFASGVRACEGPPVTVISERKTLVQVICNLA